MHEPEISPARPRSLTAILASLLLLGMAIAAVLVPFRSQLRAQLAHRDASVMAALVQQRLSEAHPAQAEDPLAAVLDASIVPELPGVLEVHLYSPEGHPFLTLLGQASQRPDVPWSHEGVAPRQPTGDFVGGPPPRLHLWLPLVSPRDSSLLGFAFLAFDATNLAEEFRLLDRRLLLRGGLAFGLSGALLAGSLLAAFHRLASANRQLAARSAQLARANRELSLAARTSAVGAVASHLVHGLRNPLAALQHAVASGTPSASDAADSARRMRAMIDDVVRVLRDEQGMDAFEVPMDEILAEAARRARLQAPEASGLAWKVHPVVGPALGNRSASLALLILENLCVNAVQALGGKGTVTLGALHEPGASRWIVTVEDDGPGIPEASHAGLFLPMSSSKRGGSGLGLALSRQIARHLGGDLSLDVSGPGGTRFRLAIPCDMAVRAASMAD